MAKEGEKIGRLWLIQNGKDVSYGEQAASSLTLGRERVKAKFQE